MIAGGKKSKEEATSSTSKPTAAPAANQPRPQASTTGNVSLSGAIQGKDEKKKKKCEC